MWGLACDYFVNNACQPRAHATMLYTKMPDTLLGTELVSIWAHSRDGEESGERTAEGKETRAYVAAYVHAWAHTCYPLRRPLARAHTQRFTDNTCAARCGAPQRATHTEICGRKCRWDLLMCLSSYLAYRSLALYLSKGTREEKERERSIRTLSELDFTPCARRSVCTM